MRRTTLAFIKGRFLLVIIFVIFMSISVRPLNGKEIIYSGIVLTIVLLFHSFLHELGHTITAVLLGFKVTGFTISRVYMEDEPSSFEEIRNSKNKVKYGIVAISGSIVTILFGYILLCFAHNLRYGKKLLDYLCWVFTLITFLIGDCGYLITGSLSMQGDPVGISAGFNISRWIVFCFGFIIAAANVLLIWRFFWLV